jgi:hypothetical protein
MGPISDSVLLELWERCAQEHPLDRALTLLGLTAGTASRGELAALPIAERDRRLFAVAAALFGPQITLISTCPECQAETELAFTVAQIEALGQSAVPPVVEFRGQLIGYRMPDSRDLARALATPDPETARRVLLGALLEDRTPDAEVLEALDAALTARAGLEVLTLTHVCTSCGASHDSVFDILDYLWRRIAARARRALWDVHLLARAYGWSSAEILSLSPERRAAHIDMVTA